MPLTQIDESLLVASYFRGGIHSDPLSSSNSDQILTLSLFYTGDISRDDCASRFANRGYVGDLYDKNGELNKQIEARYGALLDLIRQQSDLIEGGGDLQTPADPTYTACRLTDAGCQIALALMASFPRKPRFPNWPDRRTSADLV